MAYREIFQIDRRNPFAAGFDHILGAVGDLHVAVLVHGCDVTGIEPAVVAESFAAFAFEIAFRYRRTAHLQPSEGLAVPWQVAAVIVRDLHLDAARRMALLPLHFQATPAPPL